MTAAASCTVTVLHRNGIPIDMIPWGREPGWRATSRCVDCGVMPGRFHHAGCDVQRCPLCHDQMFLCNCRFDEDGPDDDEPTEGAVIELARPRADMPEGVDQLACDSNGCPTERIVLGGQEVIVHYDDIPEKDRTTVDGIACTTALRTVIDLAPNLDAANLELMVQDCLERRLFTVEEARARLAEHDMITRPGGELLRRLLDARTSET
jgi:hypothetical protein